MNYLYIGLLILLSVYPMSYAKYNWMNKQYLASAGMILLVILMLLVPSYVLFTR